MEYEWVPPPIRASIRDHLRGPVPLLRGCRGCEAAHFEVRSGGEEHALVGYGVCVTTINLYWKWELSFTNSIFACYIKLDIVCGVHSSNKTERKGFHSSLCTELQWCCTDMCISTLAFPHSSTHHTLATISQGRSCYMASKRLLRLLCLGEGELQLQRRPGGSSKMASFDSMLFLLECSRSTCRCTVVHNSCHQWASSLWFVWEWAWEREREGGREWESTIGSERVKWEQNVDTKTVNMLYKREPKGYLNTSISQI